MEISIAHFWTGRARKIFGSSTVSRDRRPRIIPPTSAPVWSIQSEKHEAPVRAIQYSLEPFPNQIVAERRSRSPGCIKRGNGAIRRGRILRNRHQIGTRGCPGKHTRSHIILNEDPPAKTSQKCHTEINASGDNWLGKTLLDTDAPACVDYLL